MKIKRKEYNRLKAIADARIRFDSPTGPILDMTMAEMYYTGVRYETDEIWWYHGPMRWFIVTERASLPSASTTPALDDCQTCNGPCRDESDYLPSESTTDTPATEPKEM